MSRTINLDTLEAEPINVEVRGKTYVLPGDVPTPLWLAVQANAEQEDGLSVASVEALAGEMLALFQVHQPQLSSLPLGLMQMVAAFGAIYNPDPPKATAVKRKPAPRRAPARKRAG